MEAPRGKWGTFLFLVIHLLSLMWTLPCLWLDNRWNKGSQVPKFQLFFFVSRRISFFFLRKIIIVFFLWGNLFSLTGHIILGNSFHFKQPKTIFSSGHFLYMLKKKKPKEKKRNPQLIMSFFKLWVRSGKKKKSNFPKWSITETNSLKNTWIKKEKNILFFSWNFLIKLRLSRQSFLPPVPKS